MSNKTRRATQYPITFYPEESGFTVAMLDLPGCISQGETLEEAYRNILDAAEGWLIVAVKRGMDIPKPNKEEV